MTAHAPARAPARHRRSPAGRGSTNGSVNENKFFNGVMDDIAENEKYIDVLGSPDTYNHYAIGWAMAFDTPTRLGRRRWT